MVRQFRKDLRRLTRSLSGGGDEAPCCSGVSVAQCHALLALEELQPCTVSELAGAMELDKSTVSRTLEKLLAAGLVVKNNQPDDRRYAIIAITDKGMATVESIHTINDRYFKEQFDALSESEMKSLFDGMQILNRILNNQSAEQ